MQKANYIFVPTKFSKNNSTKEEFEHSMWLFLLKKKNSSTTTILMNIPLTYSSSSLDNYLGYIEA